MLSIVTPAFNEATNLEPFYERLQAVMSGARIDWEWLVVDDHSRDATLEVAGRIAARDARVRAVRLAGNVGSHVAITCGLHLAGGDAVAMLAADLQDPPEILPALWERRAGGAQVVWAARREAPGTAAHSGFARLYYWLMRHLPGLETMPRYGADAFLLDREVVSAFRRYPERNVSVLALITALGFRQDTIEYDKQARAAGASGWTLARKVRLVADSITAFSALPLRLVPGLGALLLAAALLALVAVPGAVPGWPRWVLPLLLALAGVQLLAVGLVGEYLWRTLEETRRRPAWLIEARVGRWPAEP